MKVIKEKKNEIQELEINPKLFNEILEAYADETTRLKMQNKANEIEVKQIVQGKRAEFDLTIQCDSLLSLEKEGWPVILSEKYKNQDEYDRLRSIECFNVAVMGNKDTGKTFFLSHIANTIFDSAPDYHKSIKVKFATARSAITYIDTNFTDYPCIIEGNEEQSFKNHIFTEDFLTSFIIAKANIILYMVNPINATNQNLIKTLKTKLNPLLTENKKLFFIHNLRSFSTIEEVNQYYNEELKKTFMLTENNIYNEQEYKSISNENCYFTEPDRRYVHYIIGREDSAIGALYNTKAIKHIIEHIKILTQKRTFNIIGDFIRHFENNAPLYFSKLDHDKGDLSIQLHDNKVFVLNKSIELSLSEKKFNEIGTKLIKTDVFYPTFNVRKCLSNNKFKIFINLPGEDGSLVVDKKIEGEEIRFKIRGRYDFPKGNNKETGNSNNDDSEELFNTMSTGNFEVNFVILFASCPIHDEKYEKKIENGLLVIEYNYISLLTSQIVDDFKDEDDD